MNYKNFLLFLFLILSFTNCSSSKNYVEVSQPFKNYSDNPNLLIPLNQFKSDFVFRLWLFQSTSVDKVLIVFKNEKNEFEAKLIEYGKKFNGQKSIEIYQIKNLSPKNGYENFIKSIQNLGVENLKNKTDFELTYDQKVLQYFFEYKSDKENSFKYVTSSSDFKKSNDYTKLVNYLKTTFSIN